MQKINLGAGPAKLPQEVLEQAAAAILDYQQSGLSILEIPHRGKLFDAILEESKALVNELCELDNDYEILWLQGGRLQFSMIPMNFLPKGASAGYIDSGHWAAEAIKDAAVYGHINVLTSSQKDNYNQLPEWPKDIDSTLAYLYLTTNNTIFGTQWKNIPHTSVPLVADMSSDILSCPRDYKQYALFYAVAQKNIGPAGVTLVAIHRSFLKKTKSGNASMLDYAAHARQHSVLNTPPVMAIYTSLLMLRWIKQKGKETIFEDNRQKAQGLYDEIDRNSLFTGTVAHTTHRSGMNACFVAKDKDTEKRFIEFCNNNQIVGIEGHRQVGGFRASLYNAVSKSDVEKLVTLMREFENRELQLS